MSLLDLAGAWVDMGAWLDNALLTAWDVAWYLAPGVTVTVAARCGYYAVQGWLDRRADARTWLATAQAATPAPVPPRIDTRPGTDTAALDTCNAIAAARKETT
ncbi:hypothetical protein [Streptomyces sp. NPDC058155]|uniref:hypothetical protein n=1 Tax=Streptomyces sp. NPDC058155 TaxID=3346359 RepID=UPI0036E6F71D